MMDFISWPSVSAFSHCRWATPSPATGSEGTAMIFDYALDGLVTAGCSSTSLTLCFGLSGSERQRS